ncbi:hypothetical protein [Rhodococcus jostii]
MLYAPLAVSVLAGAVCAGTGIGTATPDAVTASASTADTPPASANPAKNWWSLYNYTDKQVYGEFSVQSGKTVSEVKIDKDRQLASGGHESRPTIDSMLWKSYWMGHICYNHTWYNFPRTEIEMGEDATFVLWNAFASDGESGGRSEGVPAGIRVTWNPFDPTHASEADLIRNWAEAPC